MNRCCISLDFIELLLYILVETACAALLLALLRTAGGGGAAAASDASTYTHTYQLLFVARAWPVCSFTPTHCPVASTTCASDAAVFSSRDGGVRLVGMTIYLKYYTIVLVIL